MTTVQRCYEILSSQTEAALRQCEPRRPAPVPDPIVKILISHPLSLVNTSILRPRPDFQTVQKSYRLTSSFNDNVVKNNPLSHLNCFWRAALIPDLCLFSRNLYFRFYRRKLMSILHIVKTGKKNRGSKYRCLYYIFTQLTSERTRTSRIEPIASVSWKIHDMLLSFFLRAIIQFTLTPIKWMFHSSFVT